MSEVPGTNDAGLKQNPGAMEYWGIGKKIKLKALCRLFLPIAPLLHHSIGPVMRS
jgi:hypothetical protein